MSNMRGCHTGYTMMMFIIALVSVISVSSVSGATGLSSHHSLGHILFISIPLPGHVGPLLAQGHELSRRGWSVTIASPSRLQPFITSRLVQPSAAIRSDNNDAPLGSIQYWQAGDCAVAEEAHELFLNCSLSPDFNHGSNGGSNAIFDWATRLYPCMYQAIATLLRAEVSLPRLIVADAVTLVAVDIAHDFNIPFAVNNADLLYLLSPHVLPPFDSIPGALSYTTVDSMVANDGLLERVIYPPIRVIVLALFMTTLQQTLSHQRNIVGSQSRVNVLDSFKARLILVDSAFGLEYPRPLPPLIHMVGPMIIDESLSHEDQQWLDNDPRPVVFVSFGTLAPITSAQASLLIEGLRSSLYRVIFKLDKRMHHILPSLLPDNIRVESWVSSQMAHLAHPKVKVFISHCGINSAHESVYFGTALLCIPMFGDQLDMGYRVSNGGVGVWLDKLTFTSSQVSLHVTNLINDINGTISQSLNRLSRTLRLAGGVTRAADLLEHVALYGTSHLSTADTAYSLIAFYQLDVYIIWIFMTIIPWLLLYTCARCCYCCCRCCHIDTRNTSTTCCRSHTGTTARRHISVNGAHGNGKTHDE